MPDPMPTPMKGARTAWRDLFAITASRPWLAAIAAVTCGAISLADAALDPYGSIVPPALLLSFVLALLQAFLLTPILISVHRFVIIGNVAARDPNIWRTLRFRQFFLLSAAFISLQYAPILLTRQQPGTDVGVNAWMLATVVVNTWLSLMFPAIAVDAPGLSFRNAAADLSGNVWRIFWTATVAVLPLMLLLLLAIIATGAKQLFAAQGASWHTVWVVLIPLKAIIAAASYVLLVVIASRFYLQLGQRLRQQT